MKKGDLEYLKIRTGGCWGPWLSVDVVHTDEGLRYRYIYPYGVSKEDVIHEGEYRPGDNEATSDWLTRLEGLKLYRWGNDYINDVIIDGKDNIDVKRFHTTAGSLALADNMALSDAPVIRNLRRNGAVIIGKSNMTEFANYVSTKMPGGYSC